MKQMTLEQIKSIRYRKKRLEAKCLQLQQSVSGRGASVLPLLRTPTGKYSEPRTRALAQQLADLVPEKLDELRWVRREVLCDLIYCLLRFVERSPGLYALQPLDDSHEFESYEAALAVSEADRKAGSGVAGRLTVPLLGGRWGFTGSFEDLIRAAGAACSFVYDTESPYLRDEVAYLTGLPAEDISFGDTALIRWNNTFDYHWSLEGGQVVSSNAPAFFLLLDEAYHRFCGHSIRDDLTGRLQGLAEQSAEKSREQDPGYEELLEEEDEYAQALEEAQDPDDAQAELRFIGEGPRGRYGALRFSVTMPKAPARRSPLHDPDLTETFPNREEFCQTYLRLRSAYFEDDMVPQYLRHAVEAAVDAYLCRTGQSCCMNDDDFFAAYGFLEQAVRGSGAVRRGGR